MIAFPPGETVVLPLVANCWQRIGVYGDQSCPELAVHTHCRNCPVFAAAGRRLFDRPPPPGYVAEWTARVAEPDPPPDGDTLPVVLFRVGPEWLALDVGHAVEVAPHRPVRRLPHHPPDGLVAGLVNIRGELHLAVSLARLLGLDAAPAGDPARRRLLVAAGAGGRWVFPADEVQGVRHVRRADRRPPPDTVTAATAFTGGVFAWDGRAVGHLDAGRLFAELARRVR
jgi:chemotaxis-related protein WspD